MAYIVKLSSTSTSITVNVQDLSSPASSYRYIDFSCEGTTKSTSNFYGSPPYVYSGSVTFSGLSPGRTYYVRARIYYGTTGSQLIEGEASTDGPIYIPNPYSWSWNATEQDALYHKGKTTAITWQRWNEFCEQVRLTSCWFLGYTSSSDPYNCNSAKMNSGSKILTASRFLTIKRAIGSMKPTDYDGKFPDSLIVTGRAVFGWYFIRLSEVYNGITKLQTYDMPLGAMKDLHNIELLHVEAKLEDLNRERVRQDVHY